MLAKYFITDAIINLVPDSEFVITNNDFDTIRWIKGAVPTKEAVIEECNRLFQEWRATQYQRERKPEYPPIEEFVDAYYHKEKNGDNSYMIAYFTKVAEVKAKWPSDWVAPEDWVSEKP